MAEKSLDQQNWVVVKISSGREKRIGVATTTRDWGLEVDNTTGDYFVTVRGRKQDSEDETIEISNNERLRIYVRGETLLLYNSNSREIDVKYFLT